MTYDRFDEIHPFIVCLYYPVCNITLNLLERRWETHTLVHKTRKHLHTEF